MLDGVTAHLAESASFDTTNQERSASFGDSGRDSIDDIVQRNIQEVVDAANDTFAEDGPGEQGVLDEPVSIVGSSLHASFSCRPPLFKLCPLCMGPSCSLQVAPSRRSLSATMAGRPGESAPLAAGLASRHARAFSQHGLSLRQRPSSPHGASIHTYPAMCVLVTLGLPHASRAILLPHKARQRALVQRRDQRRRGRPGRGSSGREQQQLHHRRSRRPWALRGDAATAQGAHTGAGGGAGQADAGTGRWVVGVGGMGWEESGSFFRIFPLAWTSDDAYVIQG